MHEERKVHATVDRIQVRINNAKTRRDGVLQSTFNSYECNFSLYSTKHVRVIDRTINMGTINSNDVSEKFGCKVTITVATNSMRSYKIIDLLVLQMGCNVYGYIVIVVGKCSIT
ncbi:unnamed protein product [Cuscuta europaea]|uniref:Uncharacterized protein n=1 Tax=Cuscuta europaea TaxID=41803 RepID=A0A9P1DW75_CUSEU|nr:unnamed protein product [Cuscuta europaea]